MNKEARHVKITCPQCGHINLIPVDQILKVLTPTRCQRCQTVIVRPE